MSNPTPNEALVQFRQQQAARFADAADDALLGVSPAMARVRAQVAAAVASKANVLVTGGDSVQLASIAEAIHYRCHPAGDAALWRMEADVAIPSELTRAIKSLTRDETPGTLLIESIDQLPADQQVELLTAVALESWHSPVLGTQRMGTQKADVPACSDQASVPGMSDELAAVVSTIAIEIPPIAERPEDIPSLVEWHLEQLNQHSPDEVAGIADDAMDVLMLYRWPGELAELRDVVASAHRRARSSCLTARDLPKILHHAVEHAALELHRPEPIDLDSYLSRVESLLVERALELASGNKAEAARLLGVSRPRLYRKLEQMGMIESAPTKPLAKPKPKLKTEPAPPEVPESSPPTSEAEDIEFLPVDDE